MFIPRYYHRKQCWDCGYFWNLNKIGRNTLKKVSYCSLLPYYTYTDHKTVIRCCCQREFKLIVLFLLCRLCCWNLTDYSSHACRDRWRLPTLRPLSVGSLRRCPRRLEVNLAGLGWREGTGDLLERLALRLGHKEDDEQHEQDKQDNKHQERVLLHLRLHAPATVGPVRVHTSQWAPAPPCTRHN